MAEAQRTSTLSLNPIHSNEFESLREELFDIKRIVMSNRNSKPAYPPRGPSRNQNQTLDSNFQSDTSHEQILGQGQIHPQVIPKTI